MGIWNRVKASYREAKADALEQANEAEPAFKRLDAADFDTRREQNPAVAAHYAAEKKQAAAVGQTIRGYRAGYMPAEEAKVLLLAAARMEGHPPLRLVTSTNGLEISTEDGRLLDYQTPALRHVGLFAFRARGTSFYSDLEPESRFRTGQRVGLLREPDNEHDPHAVALTTGRPPVTFGYVNKQRAKWVAELLDGGEDLDALVLQAKSSPRVLIATRGALAHLRRK
ncbi:hypothetical protein RCH21_002516 [Arthrobacter sp. PL16]|uniref:HIRAN domain-containing protein n=1 Tax=Arthrobacter sp. PL16 TaxID=3071720 RepID=UPI002DFC3EB6|nr:hypothetical protein [Arthrobacter sp. PL16]